MLCNIHLYWSYWKKHLKQHPDLSQNLLAEFADWLSVHKVWRKNASIFCTTMYNFVYYLVISSDLSNRRQCQYSSAVSLILTELMTTGWSSLVSLANFKTALEIPSSSSTMKMRSKIWPLKCAKPLAVVLQVHQWWHLWSVGRHHFVGSRHSLSSYGRQAFAVCQRNCLELTEQWSAWSGA